MKASRVILLKMSLVAVACGGGFIAPALAQVDVTKTMAVAERARALRSDAEGQAMQDCGTARAAYSFPVFDASAGSAKDHEGIITIAWSGACLGPRRHGEGALNWTVEAGFGNDVKSVTVTSAQGRFVDGQRLGLWCMTTKVQTSFKGRTVSEISDSGCSVLGGNVKPLSGNHRKLADGRWQLRADDGSATESYLSAGALEALSAKVLAGAAVGATDSKAALVVQNQSLEDLVRGARIVLAPSAEPISLKDKRVAIVLSSRTVAELDRFARERQQLLDASAGLRGEAAAERAKFIQASDPSRLLVGIVGVVKKHAKEVRPADDLVELRSGAFDYALVVDWKSATRFDQLGKYDNFPRASSEQVYRNEDARRGLPPLAAESLGAFLVGRDLKAVIQVPDSSNYIVKPPPRKWDYYGDRSYMGELAAFFATGWGNADDAAGMLFFRLNERLK